MEIRICTQKKDWDTWFFSQNQPEFLQSWEWGEFQRAVGRAPIRLQATQGGHLLGQVQGFEHRLGWGMKYVYIPRMFNGDVDVFDHVISFVNKKRYIFVRVEPLTRMPDIHHSIVNIQPRQPGHTLFLDISASEERLLEAMHAKTRYNIRLAERKGVSVRREKDPDTFWRLHMETSARDAFKTHDRDYYAHMLDLPFVFQLTAFFENRPIASNICVRFGNRFTYLHGASGNAHRNLMAPYLLQWEGIRLAKIFACREYDFWGIAPPVLEESRTKKTCFHKLCWEVDHPWTGITRFKAGFGGSTRAYPQAADIVLDPWRYGLYRLVKKIKRI